MKKPGLEKNDVGVQNLNQNEKTWLGKK